MEKQKFRFGMVSIGEERGESKSSINGIKLHINVLMDVQEARHEWPGFIEFSTLVLYWTHTKHTRREVVIPCECLLESLLRHLSVISP